jgi:predicted RNA-binding protein with RPS1 domain
MSEETNEGQVGEVEETNPTDAPAETKADEAATDEAAETAETAEATESAEAESPGDDSTRSAPAEALEEPAAETAGDSSKAAETAEADADSPKAAETAEAAGDSAETAEPETAEADGGSAESDESSDEKSETKDSAEDDSADYDTNPRPELRQLMELAVKYPEIGPPLAELAFKVGQSDIAERVVKMGLDDEGTIGVEYYAVAVDVARREGRYEEVFEQVEDALQTFEKTSDEDVTEDEANRLLHLVRNAFAVLLFDIEDVHAKPEWVKSLNEQLPRLQERYAQDPFYHCLLAQARWFQDKDLSEATWEKAVELSDGDFAWNARGTWYKDAADDFEAAEKAYRKGLEKSPDSALLLHNLAQLLTDEAEKCGKEDPDRARMMLREADELVRRALKQQTRRGLRRYIHGTRDRIRKLSRSLPPEQKEPPKKGDEVRGRVVAIVKYGAFVTIPGGYKGLLHISEIAHERVNDPGQYFKVGDRIKVKVISVEPQEDDTLRIGFSRKALLEPPKNANHRKKKRGGGKKRGGKKNNRKKKGGGKRGGSIGTLGEMLLHKLEEKEKKADD